MACVSCAASLDRCVLWGCGFESSPDGGCAKIARMGDVVIVASGGAVGVPLAFEGFTRAELAELEPGWRLEAATSLADASSDCYRIVREPWSDAAQMTRANASLQPDCLVRVRSGNGDALVNHAGVVWILPGGRSARIATDPDFDDPFEFNDLIGAAPAHAMALAGRVPLHGMAAEIDGVGVLALGQSMAGKSTLALALFHAGGRVVSDDLLMVGPGPDRAEVRALRRDLHVREGSFGLIPAELRERFSTDGAGPGRLVLRQNNAPERFASAITPHLLWFLDGVGGVSPVETQEISNAAALAVMIAATSPLFVSGRYREERSRIMPALTALVAPARCSSVRLGPGLLQSPGIVVRELLARTARASARL